MMKQAMISFQTGYDNKITDWNKFRAFVSEHRGKTQAQMAELWGDDFTQSTSVMPSKRLPGRLKKEPTAIANEIKLKTISLSGVSSRKRCASDRLF